MLPGTGGTIVPNDAMYYNDHDGTGGAILPDNGGNTQYHLAGNSTSYLPSEAVSWGEGILLPGTTYRRPRQKALGLPKKKTKMLGGYIDPNTDKYQMLK